MFAFAEMSFSSLQYLQTPLSRFSTLLESAIAAEVDAENERLSKTPKNERRQDADDWHELKMDELGQIQDLGHAFLLIALNQNVETAIDRCLDEIFQERSTETEEQKKARIADEEHKKKKKSVLGRLSRVVPMEKLPGFAEFDELRCIVNAWKHAGWVSEDLANKYPARWEAFRPLDNLAEHYARINGPVREFAREVGTRLRQTWEPLYRAEKEAETLAAGA